MQTNKRADRVWDRLIQCYGTRVAEAYGADTPKPWMDAIEDLTDEQIAFGLRNVIKITQFVQACVNMPLAQLKPVATLQVQLCEYAARHVHDKDGPNGMTLGEYSRPWTYVYREWWDATRPKGFEKCAECIGLVIDFGDGRRIGWSVAAMQADTAIHQKVLRSFDRPSSGADRRQVEAIKNHVKAVA